MMSNEKVKVYSHLEMLWNQIGNFLESDSEFMYTSRLKSLIESVESGIASIKNVSNEYELAYSLERCPHCGQALGWYEQFN